jgi:CRP-like cAMP-binding protein
MNPEREMSRQGESPPSGESIALSAFIRTSRWGGSIAPEHFAYIESKIIERQLRKDDVVYRRGDTPSQWVGVLEGELRMVRFSRRGKMTTLSRVPAGDWIGEASLMFLSQRRFDLVAKRSSRVACMSKETFIWLSDNSIPFNQYLVEKLAHRMGRLATLLAVDRLAGMTARCLLPGEVAVRLL